MGVLALYAAIVTAACGVPVAKHGNRAASSRSGAADVLSALGVGIGLTPEHLGRCLSEAGLCFMFAQSHHASMRHVAPVRVEIGTRTLFNVLGPLFKARPGGHGQGSNRTGSTAADLEIEVPVGSSNEAILAAAKSEENVVK